MAVVRRLVGFDWSKKERQQVPVKTYDLSELPVARRGRKVKEDLGEYVQALKSGKAAGDGMEYATAKDARRVCVGLYARLVRRERELGIERPQQMVWQVPDGTWRWVLRPRTTERRSMTGAVAGNSSDVPSAVKSLESVFGQRRE
jgi:hypothetical protein